METVTVTIELNNEQATVRSDGTTEILHSRVITNTATGEVIVSDMVRKVVETDSVAKEVERLLEAGNNADTPA